MREINVLNHYKEKEIKNGVNIMRDGGTVFGNPFSLSEYVNDRDVVLSIFREHFLERLPNYHKFLIPFIETSDTVNLVCCCHPKICHGDVYKEYIEFARRTPNTTNVIKAYRDLHSYVCLPVREGVDHINVYSKSSTRLGRMLSNFYRSPFELDNHGKFDSVEGYWYWLSSGMKEDRLRSMSGYPAKELGRKLLKENLPEFDNYIDKAVRAKIEQNPQIQEELIRNRLPLKHYYFYGTPDNSVIYHVKARFLKAVHDYWVEKVGALPTVIAGSRDISDIRLVEKAVTDSKMLISEVVCGMAQGVDILGYHWGKMNNVPISKHPVTKEEWQKTKAAGHIRNAKMEKVAKQGILLIKDYSKGSEGMLKLLQDNNKPYHLVRI